jgi:hypothetical protein
MTLGPRRSSGRRHHVDNDSGTPIAKNASQLSEDGLQLVRLTSTK